MTTIVNTPPSTEDSGTGIIFGVLAIVIIGVLFFVYGFPSLQNTDTQKSDNIDINVTLPDNTNPVAPSTL